ncbi:hypothetical protein BV898_15418 [Hypsibius exemplaris]|uniref:Uncharacterized protein n=1 Tax=Hypsibius exemplaris TaxID=2072580 RepID=A0A9X6RKG7_HYPEX|nr:hypothetical protein BV898_15418 [Hypsibius exemplaris]
MLDADGNNSPATTAGELNNYLYWLKYNVNSSVLGSGTDVVPYQGASPPPNSGIHRCVILVYSQLNGSMTSPPVGVTALHDDDVNDQTRATFHLRLFIRQNQLSGPVVGNFFRTLEDSFSAAQWAALASPP